MILKKIMPVFLFMIILVLAGCADKSQPVSGITKEATDTIKKVSNKYGDSTSQIIKAKRIEAEVTKEPMYFVSLKGNFRKGELTATCLEFSVLANGKRVWALRALNDANETIWEEMKSDVEVATKSLYFSGGMLTSANSEFPKSDME